MKKIIHLILCIAMVIGLAGCTKGTDGTVDTPTNQKKDYSDATKITLSDDGITVDGSAISTDSSSSVYVANDIIYYQDLDTYESGNKYGEGTAEDKHSAEEADKHSVIHITEAGSYYITGSISYGQIAVDLGSDAKTNPEAVVTLILDNANVTCTVAPAVIFYNVYECDEQWVKYDNGEIDSFTPTVNVDTTSAGANVIICDDSVNNINGSYVAKIYKDKEGEKKLYKFDGAFYSKMSMNINGESNNTGVLNITAENEGLDSELHLTINGGEITIKSQDDGINTNEDNVSVTTFNGGRIHIIAGLGEEGDGVDSNGYLVINGGTVISAANPRSDSGLDSDKGTFVNGGTVLALGSTMDWAESDSKQVTMNLQFSEYKKSTDAIVVTDTDGKIIFAYDPDKDEILAEYSRSYQGAIISCSGLEMNGEYYIYVGGDVTGTEDEGVYDVSTVTAFTGTQQGHGEEGFDSTGFGGFNPGTMPNGDFNGQMPEDFNPDDLPEGFNPDELPNGGNKPEDGNFNGQMPNDGNFNGQKPEGGNFNGQMPGGGNFNGQMPNGGNFNPGNGGYNGSTSTAELIKEFVIESRVNNFANVASIKDSTTTTPANTTAGNSL